MNWYHIVKLASNKDYFWIKTDRFPNPSEVVKNPNSDDIRRLSSYNEIRMFLVDNDLYIWSPIELLHGEVAAELKLGPNRIPLFGLIHDGKIFNVWVTDDSRRTDWYHHPKIKEIIMQHPNLMQLMDKKSKENDIEYYDQDISGPWHELAKKDNIIFAQNVIDYPDISYEEIGHRNPEDFVWILIDGKIKVKKSGRDDNHEQIFNMSQEEVEAIYRGRIEFSPYGEIRVTAVTPNDIRKYQQIPEEIILYFQSQYGNDVEIYVY